MLLLKNGKTQLHILELNFKRQPIIWAMEFRQETSLETGASMLESRGEWQVSLIFLNGLLEVETQLWTCYSV
jgi:hypothetical protein